MIIILDTIQYHITTDKLLDLSQEWQDLVDRVFWSDHLHYRKLTRKGDVWWWDDSDLSGFSKRFDSFRDYHELTFVLLQQLQSKYEVTFKIINTGVEYVPTNNLNQ